jgi:hypothetical protein
MPTPRGRRPSTAACTRFGARNAIDLTNAAVFGGSQMEHTARVKGAIDSCNTGSFKFWIPLGNQDRA